MNNALNGRKIIITGGSKGLGLVAAQAFAAQGARLVTVARSKNLLEEARASFPHPADHLCIAADPCEPGAGTGVVNQALHFLGSVDVVLHCAGGGLGLREPLLTVEQFQKLLNLNLLSIVEINQALVPSMKANGSGNLVHVGSIASAEAVGSVGYNTAKAALAAYVRSLGKCLAADGIVVTGVMPGGFYAPANAMARLQESNPGVYQEFIEKRLPRKKMADASEIVPLLSLLCSVQASMMAGCMVPIDAGEGVSYV